MWLIKPNRQQAVWVEHPGAGVAVEAGSERGGGNAESRPGGIYQGSGKGTWVSGWGQVVLFDHLVK